MPRKKSDDEKELTEIEDEQQDAPGVAEENAAVEVADEPEPAPRPKRRERMPRRPCCANC
jgi:hypothetical protein